MSADDSGIFLSVVIPAYNEELRLPQTLTAVTDYLKLQPYSWEVAVVDDGSSDGTCQVVDRAAAADNRVRLVQYDTPGNRGKGYAVRRGMLHTSGKYRLFMDADNSTTIDHFEQFRPFFEAGNAVVIGSRAAKGAEIEVHQAAWKEFLGVLGNRWIRLWAMPGIQDTQAGFKVFTGEAAQNVFPRLTIDRWGFDVEALAVARRQGYKIAERPIHWANDPNTKVRFTTYLEVLMEVVKIRWNIWRGVYDSPAAVASTPPQPKVRVGNFRPLCTCGFSKITEPALHRRSMCGRHMFCHGTDTYRSITELTMAQPAAKSKSSEAKHAEGKHPDAKQAGSQKAATKDKRILLVDDDHEIVESMRLALESKGFQVLVARDGNQGLVLCEREDPDLVILDMMMPKRSGFLVLEKLRRTRPVPLRVIMITANEGSRHKAYAEMLGVDDYIRKPFAMDRLMESVQRLLS